jgi:hypothetical protein
MPEITGQPQSIDLASTETPADLSRTEHRLEFGGVLGIGSFKLGASGRSVGNALAWLILVLAAIAVGYAVDRLAVGHAVCGAIALPLVLIAGAAILIGGAVFVVKLRKGDE